MKNYTPLILDEQAKIIEWSRKLQSKNISFSTVIEFLVSDYKCNSDLISDGLEEVRTIYNGKNQGWREQLLKALVLDRYRLENDIKEGQVVTDGEIVGFAKKIDYETRTFELCAVKDGSQSFGWFEMDDFIRV